VGAGKRTERSLPEKKKGERIEPAAGMRIRDTATAQAGKRAPLLTKRGGKVRNRREGDIYREEPLLRQRAQRAPGGEVSSFWGAGTSKAVESPYIIKKLWGKKKTTGRGG